ADLIENLAGLPAPTIQAAMTGDPVRIDDAHLAKTSERKPTAPLQASGANVSPIPNLHAKESPVKPRIFMRWKLAGAAVLLLAALGVPAVGQVSGWLEKSREVAEKKAALDAARTELARLQAEQRSAQDAARQAIEPARSAGQALEREYAAALESARQAIQEKEFTVRLSGPAHVQPGAPNKWQIETLRHGAIGRPKKLEVVVKDAKDAVLFQQTHDHPVGAATLELSAAFWERVKPGSDLFLEVAAFTDDDRKSVIAERIPLARPVYVTHLATDKPLYRPGELIRFRSLTLDRASLKPPSHDLHLRFRLRDPAGAVIPLHEGNGRLVQATLQPVLGPDRQPLRGIGVGEYFLDPKAPGGEYKLDLFEVAANKEVLLETRKFLVNKYVPDTFEKKLEFDGKSYGAGDVVQARIEVSRTAGGPMREARADLVASVDGREFHRQAGEKFALIVEPGRSRAVLNVRFKLPADLFERTKKNAPPNAVLSVKILDGGDVENILRPIPLVAKNLDVEFFPEGGDMIDGLPGRVYFQVRTPSGKPADLKGYITDGVQKLIDVATVTDAANEGVNRGHGVFTITPKAGTRYFLKITSPGGILEPSRDGHPLPAAKSDGVAIESLDAVTAKGAPIRVRLQVGKGSKSLHVGAYSRGRLIGHQKIDVKAGQPVDLAINGDDAAGGVTRVTVFEEPKAEGPGRAALIPRAERLIYRIPSEQLILNVTPDKDRYLPGGKVKLELSAVNEKRQAAPAVLLVGVVNRSVIAMADNKTDRLMPTHFLLSGDIKHPAELEHADFLLTDHPRAAAALDLLLATQGWRRFAEQNGVPVNPSDKPDVDQMLVAHGQRTSAPLELYKLEEQRVNAEYQPKLEQAHLRIASAEVAAATAPTPLAAKISAASADVALAEGQTRAASEALSSYKARFDEYGRWVAGALVIALILVVL
ncbi:MAG TPA: alpha-2-macroglobulin, partial [Urbifossiella sp.]